MNCNNYNVTMPYSDLIKWQKIEQNYKTLQDNFKNCFTVDEEAGTVDVDNQKIIELFKLISPDRYGEYNYGVRETIKKYIKEQKNR